MDEKRLRKKVALIIADYEKGRLQATPADHAQLATPRANYFLLILLYVKSCVCYGLFFTRLLLSYANEFFGHNIFSIVPGTIPYYTIYRA
jgi:hypothetical protein